MEYLAGDAASSIDKGQRFVSGHRLLLFGNHGSLGRESDPQSSRFCPDHRRVRSGFKPEKYQRFLPIGCRSGKCPTSGFSFSGWAPGQMTSWLSRFYPLMIVFLYTMMRAAAVTEKANRVAPLVNSWKFHNSHHDDDDDGLWMDHERQYAVQYISQSRAGFFIRGSQLTVPTVQKLLYYLGAVSFALFSRLSAV